MKQYETTTEMTEEMKKKLAEAELKNNIKNDEETTAALTSIIDSKNDISDERRKMFEAIKDPQKIIAIGKILGEEISEEEARTMAGFNKEVVNKITAGLPEETKKSSLENLKEELNLEEGGNLYSLKTELEEQEEETLELVETVILKVPYMSKGELLKKVVLDTTKITGRTLIDIEKMYRRKIKKEKIEGNFLKEMDPIFLTMTASVMSGVGYNTLMNLNVADHAKITSVVKGFLFGS